MLRFFFFVITNSDLGLSQAEIDAMLAEKEKRAEVKRREDFMLSIEAGAAAIMARHLMGGDAPAPAPHAGPAPKLKKKWRWGTRRG